jgi:hypothetical protein
VNNLTEFRSDDVLHHDLISKRQEIRRLSLDEAMADTDEMEPVEFTICDRLQMAIQGQPLWIVCFWIFIFVLFACVIGAVIGHGIAVFSGAPSVFS